MKIADENVVRFDEFSGGGRNFSTQIPAGVVYAAQRMRIREEEHDSRGLIIAILLCMGCWAALGYYLLS